MGHPAQDKLEEIVVTLLDADDVAEAIEKACAEHTEHAAKIRRVYARLQQAGLTDLVDEYPERIGPFEIRERVGQGGMGVVYRAWQEPPAREVALKVVRPELLHFEGSRARFAREVQASVKLSHPGIVPVHEVGETDGVPWFSMRFVEGKSLAQRLEELRTEDPASLDEWTGTALEIARQVASALHHAHARGVLHRDVKPSNIMLTSDRRAMLVDFGLAITEGAETLTASRAMLGSLPYVAPEQLRGDGGSPGPRLDVYGLGVTLYEMLALENPFLAEEPETTRRRVLAGQAPSLTARNRRVSKDLATVCAKAMSLEPESRYASAAELVQDLERVLEHRPIEARRPGPLLRFRRWQQRHPAVALAAFCSSIVAAIALFALLRVQRTSLLESQRLNVELSRALYGTRVQLADQRLRIGNARAAIDILDKCPPAVRGFEWRHMRLSADMSVKVITRHSAGTFLVSSPDRRYLVSCGFDGHARVIDVASESVRHDLRHPKQVTAGCVLDDGTTLVTACLDKKMRVFDIESGELRKVHEDGLPFTDMIPIKGRRAVYASHVNVRRVFVYDLDAGRVEHSWNTHGKPVCDMARSPDAARLATSGADGTLRVWDARTRAKLTVIRLPYPRTQNIEFAPDGDALWVHSHDLFSQKRSVQVWDTRVGTLLRTLQFDRAGPLGPFLSPNGKTVAFAGEKIDLYDVTRGRLRTTRYGPKEAVMSLIWRQDGKRFFTSGKDGAVRVFDANRASNMTYVRGHSRPVTALAVAGNERWILSGDSAGVLQAGDARAGLPVARRLNAHEGRVHALLELSGSTCASVGADRHVRIWSVPRLELEHELVLDEGQEPLCLSRLGSRLLVGCSDGFVRALSMQDLSLEREWRAHDAEVQALCCDDSGERVFSGCKSGTIRAWRGDESVAEVRLAGDKNSVTALAVSRDGRRLASGTDGGRVRVHEVEALDALRDWNEAPTRITALAFESTGRRLFSTCWDGQLRVHDPEFDSVLHTFGLGMALAVVYDAAHDIVAAAGMTRIVSVFHGRALPRLSDAELERFRQGASALPEAGASGPDLHQKAK